MTAMHSETRPFDATAPQRTAEVTDIERVAPSAPPTRSSVVPPPAPAT